MDSINNHTIDDIQGLLSQGLPFKKIADKIGMSKTAVLHFCKKRGLKSVRERDKPLSIDVRIMIRALRKQRLSYFNIGVELGAGRQSIARYCDKAGIGLSDAIKTCKLCGNEFFARQEDQWFCTYKCSAKYNGQQGRAKRRDAYVEDVTVEYLFKRDGGRCKICGRKLNLKRRQHHPLKATVDHIVPVSIGGKHEKKNTQLACLKCNMLKGNRVIDGGEQLLLFG
jgi:hypothetical protein